MKFLKWLLIIIVALAALVLAVAAFMPSQLVVERSVTINAPSSTVFEKIADYNHWNNWSVLNLRDSTIKTEFEGEPMELGHKMTWVGDPELSGTGEQTITEIALNKYIKGEIKFYAPMESEMIQEFNIKEVENDSEVSWITRVDLNYPFGRFMGGMIESMVAPNLEEGLKNLKQYVEAAPKGVLVDNHIMEAEPGRMLYFIRDSVMNMNNEIMTQKFTELYGELGEFFAKNGLQMAGAPVSINQLWDQETGKSVFDAGFPTMDTSIQPTGRIQKGMMPSGLVLKGTHQGPYDTLENTYTELFRIMHEQGLAYKGLSWEEYVNDPEQVPASEILTFIYILVQPLEE